MASSVIDGASEVFDRHRVRPGWELRPVDVAGITKRRWVNDADNLMVKHSSLVTHFGVNERDEDESSSSSSEYEQEDANASPHKKSKTGASLSILAAPHVAVPTPKKHRYSDGLFSVCQSCDNKKRAKVVECACEPARRAALSKLLARRDVDSKDPTYLKHFNEVKSAVDVFDAACVDDESDASNKSDAAEQTAIRLRCPHCSQDLFLCTQTPFSKEDDPFSK
jgi:hypothetical protein